MSPPTTETTPLLADDATAKDPEVPAGLDLDKPRIPGVKLSVILPAISIGVFLAAMDNTIIVSSYGIIGTEMKELNRTSWIATSYLLTLTSFQPLYGKLSDIFGRKQALLSSYLIFGLGCLGCGLARNMNELIVARAFAGIGGGGMTTVASILLSDIVSLRARGTFQGLINIVFATGAAVGAPIGGLFADSIGWRWSFLAQVPLTWIAILVVSLFLHLPPPAVAEGFRKQIKRVDFLGAAILVSAVFSLLVGLDRAGNVMLNDNIVIGTLTFALLAFLLFVYVEGYIAAEPFAPGHIVKERTILASSVSVFFAFGGYMGTLFYITLYYQAVAGLSAAESGLRIVPAIIGGVTGSLFGGVVMQTTGKFYHLTVGAYCVFTCGFLPILLLTGLLGRSTLWVSLGLMATGFGNGVGVTSTLIAVISAAGAEEQAVATAVTYLFRALGTVTGVSVGSMLVQGSLRRELSERLNGTDADEIVRRVRQSLKFINELPQETKDIVVNSYEHAVHAAFVLGITFAVCAALASMFIRNKSL
ncbi:uncharacterized protein H6S33_011832 [Morchella sextelata]|uniref:uncharacterized protein n=1 Tax=Morchella sextelata TaxID=1174677 RepID=UPI001D05B8BD|nr:uncharacterized protein H6S33_011832 [Morchella sextelata]KAH0610305.1 hypothetical protein H6S33_011832 [Morchella sextelata]